MTAAPHLHIPSNNTKRKNLKYSSYFKTSQVWRILTNPVPFMMAKAGPSPLRTSHQKGGWIVLKKLQRLSSGHFPMQIFSHYPHRVELLTLNNLQSSRTYLVPHKFVPKNQQSRAVRTEFISTFPGLHIFSKYDYHPTGSEKVRTCL
jgi:hypothetical protein